MKGGVTILLSTLKALHEAGFEDFPCKVILDADEEPAHVFSNAPEVIKKEAEGAKCAFNFETGFTDHSLVVQRKGCWRFFIETFGRGCHVGNDPKTEEVQFWKWHIKSLKSKSSQITLNSIT